MNNRQRQTLFGSMIAAIGGMARGMADSGRIFRRSRNKYSLKRTAQGEAAKDIAFGPTRQQIRARLRAESFAQISEHYNEPRPVRRRIALAMARNRYRASTVGVAPSVLTKGAAA